MSKKRVVGILQHRLLHYRVRLFQEMRERLAEQNVDLRLIHGQPSQRDRQRRDCGHLDWSTPVRNKYFNVRGIELIWQKLSSAITESDLLVIIQENRVLSNYPLLLRRLLAQGSPKIAFWGHGVNFQSNKPRGIRERWKTIFANKVDWWFAYTEITKNILVQRGFPPGKITCLNNTIDTKSLQRSYDAISSSDVESVASELGVTGSKNVCVFCGSLYKEKKIDFMLNSCSLIQQEIPDFHLIIIGDGPDRYKVKSEEERSSWLHYVGPITDDERLKYFRISRLMINPGLLGLHILDSFTTGVPLVSTTDALHSPEIAYLQNGINGILVTGNERTYARAVAELLRDDERYARIRDNGLRDAKKYSIENMAANFAEGIHHALRL